MPSSSSVFDEMVAITLKVGYKIKRNSSLSFPLKIQIWIVTAHAIGVQGGGKQRLLYTANDALQEWVATFKSIHVASTNTYLIPSRSFLLPPPTLYFDFFRVGRVAHRS